MKHSILITLPLKERHIEKIRTAFPDAAVHFFPGNKSVTEYHAGCTIYLGIPTREEFEASPNIAMIQAGYAGVDALPLDLLEKRETIITSAKGIHNTQMSELFFAMVLYCGRNMGAWSAQKIKREWNKQPVKDTFFLGGKTLCIVGYGTIGKKIAMIAQTFDMRVTGVRSSIAPEDRLNDPFTDEVIPVDEIINTLSTSDVVLNLLPLTPTTENFFNAERLGAMKAGSIFVNLGRGGTVDDEALINALDNETVRCAALDVFREEPLPEEHPFWSHPRIIITPHIGGLMPDYWGAVVDLFIENLRRYINAEEVLNVVDKEKGY